MANLTRISVEAAIARANALTALLNGGSIKLYTGSPPASVAIAATGTLLVSCALSATAFGGAAAGGPGAQASANAITATNAAATGVAGWFRAYKADGVTGVIQGRIGGTNADFIMQSVNCTSGVPVVIPGWVLNEPTG